MKPPRPVRAAPGSMAGMREKHLRQMLEQLHTELQRADTIDDRSRELLRSVLGDIEDPLERSRSGARSPSRSSSSCVWQSEPSRPRTRR
jgi:Domain of unknown function (DUF4404)